MSKPFVIYIFLLYNLTMLQNKYCKKYIIIYNNKYCKEYIKYAIWDKKIKKTYIRYS